MASRTDIINRALIKLGAPTIADPNEDSEQALKAGVVFDTLLRSELRMHPWSFAIKRATLAPLTTAPAYEWTYAYQLPSDFLRIVMVNDYWDFAGVREANDAPAVPYSIEGQQLLTNFAAPLKFRYVYDVSADPNVWDALFVETFACRLGEELCETLTKSAAKKATMETDYRQALRDARRVNAIELPPQPLPDNSWVTGRY
ncbi:hypothetical protein UFOVP68_11 [uncultured Caudovirales phage]|uniref:Tail tubular protein A n=1 Tax=uncultured Caudovirales phage TaxID=2100421 RepID=A0A6J5L2B8_9CAUD|nr:hypothetical protein UFOVP68_11 [uncultured Caudovirales phage]